MNPSLDAFTQADRASRAAIQALWDIQSGFLRKSAYLQFSLATIGVEGGVRQWQFWSTLAERDALISGQKQIAVSFQPRLSAVARETTETLRALGTDLLSWTLGTFTPDVSARVVARPKARPSKRRAAKKKSG